MHGSSVTWVFVMAFATACGGAPEPLAPIAIPIQPAQPPPSATASDTSSMPIARRPDEPRGCGDGAVALANGRCFAIAGTRWSLRTEMPTNDTRTFDLELLPGGRAVSHDPADKTDDDEWEADGTHLHFWFNNRYVVYDANSLNEEEMAGTALNVVDAQWPWTARRLR